MLKQLSPPTAFAKTSRTSSFVLASGFGLTGASTVMLGVLLPTLSQAWQMGDGVAGYLFFLQFLGSSLGAVASGPNRIRSLRIGYGLLIVSAGALPFAGLHLAFPVFFLFGLGLGMAMTSTSLLFSDRFPEKRATELERLNFIWSIGATAAPVLFLPFLRAHRLPLLFFILQGLSFLMFLWVALRERQDISRSAPTAPTATFSSRPSGAVLPFILLAMFAVGVETALGGWLTTYSHRSSPRDAGTGALATSVFWFGIMLGRFIFSTSLLARIGRPRVLSGALWMAAASVALLIFAQHPTGIRLAAGLCGLSIGPLYPLLLAFALERSPRGWIFAAAGAGAAIFPWLTGQLSAHFGSLRYGLIAPCGATLLMVVLCVTVVNPDLRRELKTPRP